MGCFPAFIAQWLLASFTKIHWLRNLPKFPQNCFHFNSKTLSQFAHVSVASLELSIT
jgi:hypothetical protein